MNRIERRRLAKEIPEKYWRYVWHFTHEGLRIETHDNPPKLIAFFPGV